MEFGNFEIKAESGIVEMLLWYYNRSGIAMGQNEG